MCAYDLLSVYDQYLSSEWQTTTLRHQLSPTEKVLNSGWSSTVMWIRYRSLLGRGGNRSTLDGDTEGMTTEKDNKAMFSFDSMKGASFITSMSQHIILI